MGKLRYAIVARAVALAVKRSLNEHNKKTENKVTATGYDEAGNETGKAEILLANYKTDNDLPVKEWIWFDLTPIQNAVKVKFIPDSSDKNEYGIKTAAYFCLDGITLIEK